VELMRVGELARRTGVGVSTLRAWERRFGFLSPLRSESGQRQYTEGDVERVATVCRLVADGMTLSAAIGRVVSAGSTASTAGQDEVFFLRQVLHAAEQGIWVMHEDRTRYANRRMAELLGCSIDELLDRPVSDFVDPAEGDGRSERARLARAGKRQLFQVRLRRSDSSTFVAEVRNTPLRTADGRYEGTVAVLTDVTTRHQDEATARYRNALLDAIGDAVIATLPDGTIEYANPAVERLLGWRPSDLIGQNGLTALGTDEGREGSRQIHARLVAGNHFSGDRELSRRDGTRVAARVTGAPVLNDRQELVGLIAVLSDSSERRRRELEVQNQAQQAETVAVMGLRALRSAPHELELLLAEIVAATRRVLQSDQAALLDVVAGQNHLALRVASPSIENPSKVPSGSRSLTGYTALAGKVVVVEDMSTERRFDTLSCAGELGIRSSIAAPVFRSSEICAVLMTGVTTPRKYDRPAVHFVQSMANVISVALDRASPQR
jgi:PAS domain S-box-containing protein